MKLFLNPKKSEDKYIEGFKWKLDKLWGNFIHFKKRTILKYLENNVVQLA